MMLPNLNFGIENLPERTSECFPGNASAPRGTLRQSSGVPGSKCMDYSTELLENSGAQLSYWN